MSSYALKMENVSKKFKRGTNFDSLRDLIPAMVRSTLNRAKSVDLEAKEFWALKDINFEVGKGEALGIIGHNGAGKSTMLKLLCGLFQPTTGKIHVNGRLSALLEVSAGFHPDLTGRENVYLYGTILGMRKDEVRRKFSEIVEFSGLEDFIDTPVKRYSSGMHARLGFSVAAHLEPDVLIIDEVLSVGDHVFQTKGIEKMTSVLRNGTTVIFVSHNLRAMANLCPKSILLSHGQIMHAGPTDETLRHYMKNVLTGPRDLKDKAVHIGQVTMNSEQGEAVQFESGQKAYMEVEITAKEAVNSLALELYLKDDEYYSIFITSSTLLGFPEMSLKAGETRRLRFDLTLHLAPGTYHSNVVLYHHLSQKAYDSVFPATTFYISSAAYVRGVVNLYPSVTAIP